MKKRSIYQGYDVTILGRLSKQALLDIAVFRLRMQYTGNGDEALTTDQLREAIEPDLTTRGDRLPKGLTRLMTKGG